ncbi:MAG TPA: hypothetical protein VMD03_01885 [Steroidobacteraceae bacterium]|nr:hypothetical protein [Steroidobacteraceae bacterium]
MSRRASRLMGFLAAGIAIVALAGCGLAETTTVAAASGVSEAEQAKQAQGTLNHVKQQLDDAAQQAAEQREAAEKDTQ